MTLRVAKLKEFSLKTEREKDVTKEGSGGEEVKSGATPAA